MEKMSPEAALLRHFLATLAYRTHKALDGAPDLFGSFEAGNGVRTPHKLLAHMRGVLTSALRFFTGRPSDHEPAPSFREEIARFDVTLAQLTKILAARPIPEGTSAEKLLQGPLSDAMTHAGQLALLRRLAGSSIPAENFHAAPVNAGESGSRRSQHSG